MPVDYVTSVYTYFLKEEKSPIKKSLCISHSLLVEISNTSWLNNLADILS